MFCVTTNVMCYLTAHLLRSRIIRKLQMVHEALAWQTTRPLSPSSTRSTGDLLLSPDIVLARTQEAQLVPLKLLAAPAHTTTERTDDYSRDPGVAFDGGFYLVASAALLSVIACGIVLLSRAFPRVLSRSTRASAAVAATSAAAAARSRPVSAAASSTPSSPSTGLSAHQEERTRTGSRLTRFAIIRSLFRRRRAETAGASAALDAADALENDDPPPYADDTDQELLLATPEPPAPPARNVRLTAAQLMDAIILDPHRAEPRVSNARSSVLPDAGEVTQTADDVPLLEDVGGFAGSNEEQPPSTAPIGSISAEASTSASGSSIGSSGASRPRGVRFASPLVALEEEAVASGSAGWRSASRPGRPTLRTLGSPSDPSASATGSASAQPQPDSPPPDYSP